MNTEFPTYNCLYLKSKKFYLKENLLYLVHNTFIRNQKGGEGGGKNQGLLTNHCTGNCIKL